MDVELLKNEQTHPVKLATWLTEQFGVDWLGWGFLALTRTIEREVKVPPARLNMHKAMACAAVMKRDAFWEDWVQFHFLAQALNNNVPDPQTHHPLSVGQMMVAVDIATTLRGMLGSLSYTPEFSEEVARYVAAQSLTEGAWYLPPPLNFAAKHAEKPSYRCNDCGHESEILFEDLLCDVCVNRFDTSSLGAWEADPKRVAAGWGRNTVRFSKNPVEGVKARLKAAQAGDQLTETRDDICAARIVAALNYLRFRRSQLQEQMK